MIKEFMSMSFSHYQGGGFHFYWVFYKLVVLPTKAVCPMDLEVSYSMITKIFPNSQMLELNPEGFFKYCSGDFGKHLPKLLQVPSDTKLSLPEMGWETICSSDVNDWSEKGFAELLEKNTESGFPNLVIVSDKETPTRYFSSCKELEVHKNGIIDGEKWDGYHYYSDEYGNQWCSGVSLKEDLSRCDDFRELNPEECKNCKRR